MLCHCYGEVEGHDILGKVYLRSRDAASLSYDGQEYQVYAYHVLMWK
jgi:hypothetical protein